MTMRRVGEVVLPVLAGLGLILGIWLTVIHLTTDPLADARAYYDAGARLNAGEPLYLPVANTTVPGSYHYPPLLAIVFRPLALLPYASAAIIWEAVIIGATLLTFVRLGWRRAVLITAGLLALTIGWTIAIGQAQALVTLLLAIGSPWAVALAANLKLYPLLVAVYWVGRREWTNIGRLAAWLTGFVALQLVLEPTATLAYLGFLGDEQVRDANNLSLFALSPVLWLVSVIALALLALRLAPTRWGWAAAVTLSVLAAPRLLSYQLSTLLAALGGPDVAEWSGRAATNGASRPDTTGR
jgi:Glycosyltransferase family 87